MPGGTGCAAKASMAGDPFSTINPDVISFVLFPVLVQIG
jgi:hypothetical protein